MKRPPKEKVLTKVIADNFVTKAVPESQDEEYGWKINSFDSIDEDAARVLKGYKEGSLHLNGIKTISEKAAQFLALHGLHQQSRWLAAALWNTRNSWWEFKPGKRPCKLYTLELCGLKEISDSIAKALSKYQGMGGLSLSGLKRISDSSALSLSKMSGLDLNLNGLTEISETAAKAIANFKGRCGSGDGNLTLYGLSIITEPVAKALGKFKGNSLTIGLTSLNESCAHHLAKVRASLRLDYLGETIPDKVGKALARRPHIPAYPNKKYPTLGDFVYKDSLRQYFQ